MAIHYLSKREYDASAMSTESGHWDNYADRWVYHKAAAGLARLVGPELPGEVLEIGTMGISIVRGSDTLDYPEKWGLDSLQTTIRHDAKTVPWPIERKRYKLVIALRVFHHLTPRQEECFMEAKRVGRHLIIVVPDYYDSHLYPDSRGISEEQFTVWNHGVPPTLCIPLPNYMGNLLYWMQIDNL
jgi:hypothetical protein